MSDAEILAIGKQVAQCIRDNGVPDFPDPFVERGRLQLPENAANDMEGRYSQQVLDQAEQACKPIMDRLPESAIKGEEESDGDDRKTMGADDIETLKKLAQCLRENGIPEWPDPKPDGTFPLVGTPLEAEGKSDRFIAAGQACRQYFTGSITFS